MSQVKPEKKVLPVPTHTPAGRSFTLPNTALSAAIAAEWQAQDTKPDFATMPFTRIAFTAIDRVADQREGVIDEMVRYAETDLVCYRAQPGALRARQEAEWGRVLGDVQAAFNVVFAVAEGIMPVPQPQNTLDRLRDHLATYDDMTLSCLSLLMQVSGSVVLALAYAKGLITADQLPSAAQMEERYQLEQWGEDEALRVRVEKAAKEINEAAHFYTFLYPAK